MQVVCKVFVILISSRRRDLIISESITAVVAACVGLCYLTVSAESGFDLSILHFSFSRNPSFRKTGGARTTPLVIN